MDANKLREEIIARAKNRGADIVAFGGIDRFEDENILKIYPETKTVICLALRVLRGSYRGVEEGTTYYQYVTTGVEVLEETLLPMILLDVSAAIEDAGYTAIPQRRNQMLLPDELRKVARPHPRGERLRSRGRINPLDERHLLQGGYQTSSTTSRTSSSTSIGGRTRGVTTNLTPHASA